MNCAHWIDEGRSGGGCALGMYGGHRISLGTCEACIKLGNNNEEYAKELFARFAKSHPEGVPRASGCCDNPKNYPK